MYFRYSSRCLVYWNYNLQIILWKISF